MRVCESGDGKEYARKRQPFTPLQIAYPNDNTHISENNTTNGNSNNNEWQHQQKRQQRKLDLWIAH